jgi:hypothetical protein
LVSKGIAHTVRRLLVFFALLLFAACSDDLTIPPPVNGVYPPQPENFVVTTSDDIVYDLSWTVSDTTVISFYRLYALDIATGNLALQDTSGTRAVQVNTLVPTPGLIFGVSSVSTDRIESAITTGAAQ